TARRRRLCRWGRQCFRWRPPGCPPLRRHRRETSQCQNRAARQRKDLDSLSCPSPLSDDAALDPWLSSFRLKASDQRALLSGRKPARGCPRALCAGWRTASPTSWCASEGTHLPETPTTLTKKIPTVFLKRRLSAAADAMFPGELFNAPTA